MARTVQRYDRLLLDIDGVLIQREEDTIVEVWSLLNALQKAGVEISLVTARPFALCRAFLDKLGNSGAHIFDSGATIIRLGNSPMHQFFYLPHAIIHKVLAHLNGSWEGMMLGLSTGVRFYANPRYTDYLREYIHSAEIQPISEAQSDVTGIWIKRAPRELVLRIRDSCEGQAIVRTGDLIEATTSAFVAPKNSGKLQGVRILSQLTACDMASMVFIGDDVQDLDTLNEIGLAATVANACPEVKSVCKVLSKLTFSVGVADLIKKIWRDEWR